ncbi:MAG: MotA/TolQ/ExbB proton channel family protein [Candidatus Omnitrophica bacterium]|nr:MotA/TolQ/ExbB proton channel family protein [Candidatus Omnitrophota bacterium]
MWEISPWELFLMGGPLMWPILGCSIVAMAIVIEKLVYLNRINEDITALKNRIFAAISRNDIKEALKICDHSGSPVAIVLRSGLLQYGRDKEEITVAMDEASQFGVPVLEERLPALLAIGNIAPLLGLLGTVTGMCLSFHLISLRSAALNPVSTGDIAAGVWQSLISTAAGLIVAIPVYVAYHFLVSCVQRYVLQMEKAASDLANFLTRVPTLENDTSGGE